MPRLGGRSDGPRGEQHRLGRAWLEMADLGAKRVIPGRNPAGKKLFPAR